MEHTVSMIYADMKNKVDLPLALYSQYSVTRLAKLSESIFAQLNEQPYATQNMRGTHGMKKCDVSSLPNSQHVIIATYLYCGSSKVIE